MFGTSEANPPWESISLPTLVPAALDSANSELAELGTELCASGLGGVGEMDVVGDLLHELFLTVEVPFVVDVRSVFL